MTKQDKVQQHIQDGKTLKEAINLAYTDFHKETPLNYQQGGNKVPSKYELPLYIGNTQEKCKGGKGCSEIATDISSNLLNTDRNQLAPQDAWYKKEAIIRGGGREVWNAKNKDYSNVRVGDFVSLDRSGDYHKSDASKVPGYSLKNNEGNEHLGTVVGKNEKGQIMVKHGSSDGNIYVQPINEVNIPEYGFDYKPLSIYRAKANEGKDVNRNDSNYKKLLPNEQFNITGGSENEKKYISAINSNMSAQQRNTNLSPNEIKRLNSLSFGVFHNESEAGNSNTPIGGKMILADTAHKFGRSSSASLSDVQIKYEDLYNNSDGSTSKVGKLMDKISVNSSGLNSPMSHRDDYNDEVNSVFAVFADRLESIKANKDKYNYDNKTKTVYGNIPVDDLLIASYKNPNVLSHPEKLKNLQRYVDNGLKYARNINKDIRSPTKQLATKDEEELVFNAKKGIDKGIKVNISRGFIEGLKNRADFNPLPPNNKNKLFQQGGSKSWDEQLERVRKEKLQNNIKPTLSVADLIAEKKLRDQNIGRELPNQIQKDNTNVTKIQDNIKNLSDKDILDQDRTVKLWQNEKNTFIRPIPTINQDNRSRDEIEKAHQTYKDETDRLGRVAIYNKAARVIPNIMQIGNFSIEPVGQTIGKIGSALDMAITAYDTYDDINNENYGSAALNVSSAAAPYIIKNPKILGTYKRNMVNRLNRTTSPYLPIDRLYGTMTDQQLLGNRATFSANIADGVLNSTYESNNSTKQQGGGTTLTSNELAFLKELKEQN
jgi:hypothetical protein